MDHKKSRSDLENLPVDLKRELGTITTAQELIPGVYYLTAQTDGGKAEAFYLVSKSSAVSGSVCKYGRSYPDWRAYPVSDDTSGWRIVEYELGKYQILHGGAELSPEAEREFRRMALFAAGHHPEYFGEYPVPFYTPRGFALRHQKLENGIYWLETSQCEELLAVCYPIWNTEFTSIARVIGEPTETDRTQGFDKTMGSLFFNWQSCCVAFYELMQTRPLWDGTLVDRPALMNAIWKFCPKYAAMAPKLRETEWKNYLSKIKIEREKIIGIYPNAGDDFLLFRKKS